MTTVTTLPSASPTTRTGLTLFFVGLVGVASLLTVHFPTNNLPKQVLDRFSPAQLRLLMLVNPLLLLLVSVAVGALLHRKVGLLVFPQAALGRNVLVKHVLRNGIAPGTVAGGLIIGVVWVFQRLIPAELAKLGDNTDLTALARFLYGGVTEEIMVRFGLMTLFVWLLRAMFRVLNPVVYWIAISGAALLFGAGHLPALRSMVPDPSTLLVLYIIVANALAGTVFGWVYWRYGLVFAMMAHAVAHVVLLVNELVVS